MRKILAGIIAALSLVAVTGQSDAQDLHSKMDSFFSGFHRVKQRNAAWPQPFLRQDQVTYRSFFRPMIESGWVAEATLSPVHFTREGNKLNGAGIAKIAGILNNFPKAKRKLYVAQSYNKELTTQRMSAVQDLLTKWEVAPGNVTLTTTPYATPYARGGYVETYYQNYIQALDPPTLNSLGGGGVAAANGGG